MTISIDKFIDKGKLADLASQCVECEECFKACCSFLSLKKNEASPMGRLKVLSKFFNGIPIKYDELEAIYLCTECGGCDVVCSAEISISEVIADSKIALAESGQGPLEQHHKMIQSIFDKGNAVSGKPEKRLDWIPEKYRDSVKFEDAEGDILLYVGCLSSFVDKQTASASFEVLKKGGVDFKLLKDEFCCGIYPYNAGKIQDAEKIFKQMLDKFEASGIKKIIVPCAGCYRAFSKYYPRVLNDFHIEILHISEVMINLLQDKKITPVQQNRLVTYHDACKLGRKSGFYEEPREILSLCGYEISELKQNRERSACCGSGSGVRSISRGLSMDIASGILSDAETDSVVSTCPFCIFNFNYTAHKKSFDKKAVHISVLAGAELR